MDEQEIFPLDDAAIEYIAELQKHLDQMKHRAELCEAAMNGTLSYFARLHNLQGTWKLAPNGRELVRETQCQTLPREA